jgi:hypothetical protein
MRARFAGILFVSTTLSVAAAADDLTSTAQALCEKVRSCAMSQVAQEDLTPELRQMMEPMLDSMCDQVRSRVQGVSTGHPLYQPAVACMRSMESLTCEDMRSGENLQTAECEAYEKQAREYADG